MTACGGYFIGGEIKRNEQCPHEADLRRLSLRIINTLVGCGAKPRRNPLLALKFILKNITVNSIKSLHRKNHSCGRQIKTQFKFLYIIAYLMYFYEFRIDMLPFPVYNLWVSGAPCGGSRTVKAAEAFVFLFRKPIERKKEEL